MNTYIAFFIGIHVDENAVVPMERLEYAFHTFSLRNECAYEPTGDVTFASINPDAEDLSGGVKRMVEAVLVIEVEAVVRHSEDIRRLLDVSLDEEIQIAPGIVRGRSDLEALYEQSLGTHEHEH